MIGKGCAAADGEDPSAFFHELFEGRNGFIGADIANRLFEFIRSFFGFGVTESSGSAGEGWHGTSHEDDDIVFGFEITFVDLLGIDQVCLEFELFHDPAHPTGRHGSAIGIPEGDAGRLNRLQVDGFFIRSLQVRSIALGNAFDGSCIFSTGFDEERTRGKVVACCIQAVHLAQLFLQDLVDSSKGMVAGGIENIACFC